MISVIIPAYNAERTIGRCLKAAFKQSYPSDSYEVIVIDDGSTDRTPEIIKDYRVRYFRQENQGPAAARNRGARQAKGEVILFTDSDCVMDSNWVREMARPFDDPEIMAVKGVYKTTQKSLVARFTQLEFEERFEMLKKVESIDMVDTYSAGFRRSVFLEMKGFDTSFPVANNEDTEFSYRMSKLGYKMVFNPEAKVSHLNHSDSIIKYVRLKFSRGFWRMMVYKKFPKKMLKDTYTPQLLKLQIIFVYLSLCMLWLAWIWPWLWFVLFFSITAFFLSTLPFANFALRRDKTIGILSPFFLFTRALSLGAGITWWVLSNYNKRNCFLT